jgi:hypothetical protein
MSSVFPDGWRADRNHADESFILPRPGTHKIAHIGVTRSSHRAEFSIHGEPVKLEDLDAVAVIGRMNPEPQGDFWDGDRRLCRQ